MTYRRIRDLDFGISRIFDNNKLADDVKCSLRKRLVETEQFVTKYNLSGFLAGISSFDEVRPQLPPEVSFHGKRMTTAQLEDKLQAALSIDDKAQILKKIRLKIYRLIEDQQFDFEKGIFKFIDARRERELLRSRNIALPPNAEDYGEYIPKVWTNSLAVLALVKWKLFSNEKNDRLDQTILKGLVWIQDNKHVYEGNRFGWAEYGAGLDRVIKMFETTLALQTLLRARKLIQIHDQEIFDLSSCVSSLIEMQDTSEDMSVHGRWPSELFLDSEGKIEHVNDAADIGSTGLALQFLSDALDQADIQGNERRQCVTAIQRGCNWLTGRQNTNGSWNRVDSESINFSTNAIQALVKTKQYCPENGEALLKGVDWLGNEFCLQMDGDIVFAWPKEDDALYPCEKNTSLAVSTLLKAGVSPHSYVIRKAILWLLSSEPGFKFDEVYIYCAMLDYLKRL